MTVARTLIDLAVRIAPANGQEWVEALRAELDHVPSGDAPAFAAGGLATALRLRLRHPPFVLGAARYGLAAGALIWAALHLWFVLPQLGAEPKLPLILELATAVVFGLGGLLTAAAGLRATCWFALPPLVALGVYTGGAGVLMPDSPNQAYYRALALEDTLALTTALAVAIWARGYARRRDRLAA